MGTTQETFYDEDGNSRVIKREPRTGPWFDYDNQAWVVDGVYQRCGHDLCNRYANGDRILGPEGEGDVSKRVCFGTLHEDEKPSDDIRMRYEPCAKNRFDHQHIYAPLDDFCIHCQVKLPSRGEKTMNIFGEFVRAS